ncbi:fumarylacetoacetate hydrolase family protein [Hydrogenophaga sp. BPS33]|uniref:fumarylacetoacetate hydrolase family protein n=1 Tax=Hydrogenophaga sp. BPS33 TaxID=2651974 RepID=UPI00131F9ACE|nr:fumarylacetoacetate hydrolase family protein [Hydrogenophaga sp. BPS33]QHE84175.1 fumarylacetoacetate hydrolase family protein [Hydrogenophaga sp. BPS33]
MKLVSFDDFRVGVVDGDAVHDVTALLPPFLDALPRQRINHLIGHWSELGPVLSSQYRSAPRRELAGLRLLPPNPAPGHVFAAPANYAKHIGEIGNRSVTTGGRSAREQGFFLMAPGSLVGSGQSILLPKDSSRRFDHESELAVVIGRAGRNIPREQALSHVFGYACLIDATMRIEKGSFEEERTMRKSFETFNPMGPWIVTADEVPDPQSLSNRLWVNGELRQSANTGEMIVGVAELIELISSVLPLQPGDVIASGTPEGVGPIEPGDEVRIEIESVGAMTLSVREHAQRAPRPY